MEQSTTEVPEHIYEVGMGSDKRRVSAPSAGAAAMFYGLQLIMTNNPFMTVVYSEDGAPWQGESYWLNFAPDKAHVEMVAERVKHELSACRVVKDAD